MHHPPHIFLDQTWHLITATTVGRAPLLAQEGAKELFRDTLQTMISRFDLRLLAWVVLDNHYHLLVKSDRGERLPDFIRQLHGASAHRINRAGASTGRQVWHNYWDAVVRSENDLWTRFNYLHHNPVKHSYVRRLEDWPFSSYRYYVRTKGEVWLRDCLARYPVIDFITGDDLDNPKSALVRVVRRQSSPVRNEGGDEETAD